jgi:tetratricopeptide (TPR) repeat protein
MVLTMGFPSPLLARFVAGFVVAATSGTPPKTTNTPTRIAEHAIGLAKAGRCAEALPALHRAEALLTAPDLRRQVGMAGVKCGMAINQAPEALHFLEGLTRAFPHDAEVLYLATHVYSDLSLRASQDLLFAAPGSPQVHELNAEALETQGKWKEALFEYQAALEKDPRLAGVHYRIGRLLLSQPQTATSTADAKKEFEQELAIDPSNAGAEYVLGELARQAGDWNASIQHFSRAAELDVNFADAYIGLGRALTSAGRPQDAIAPLETAVKLEPENPSAHFFLGAAYRHAGRNEDAARQFALHKEMSDKANQKREQLHTEITGPSGNPQ